MSIVEVKLIRIAKGDTATRLYVGRYIKKKINLRQTQYTHTKKAFFFIIYIRKLLMISVTQGHRVLASRYGIIQVQINFVM